MLRTSETCKVLDAHILVSNLPLNSGVFSFNSLEENLLVRKKLAGNSENFVSFSSIMTQITILTSYKVKQKYKNKKQY